MVKPVKLSDIFKETEELIAIIAKSITTAQKNKGWCLNEHWALLVAMIAE